MLSSSFSELYALKMASEDPPGPLNQAMLTNKLFQHLRLFMPVIALPGPQNQVMLTSKLFQHLRLFMPVIALPGPQNQVMLKDLSGSYPASVSGPV